MPDSFRASRDVIIRTEQFEQAVHFYESVLGLAIVHRSDTLVGFDAGAFRLYVEPGPRHGAVFDFRVPEMPLWKRIRAFRAVTFATLTVSFSTSSSRDRKRCPVHAYVHS
jgi:catechol 2,3-dioxygenase-like lactoylglutathione lyase family enzyme